MLYAKLLFNPCFTFIRSLSAVELYKKPKLYTVCIAISKPILYVEAQEDSEVQASVQMLPEPVSRS